MLASSRNHSNMLWVLAIAFMLCDHIGAYLLPEYSLYLRAVGRFGLPIWGFAIAAGFLYSRDRLAYFDRVYLVAVCSELPYWWVSGHFINPVWSFVVAIMVLDMVDRSQWYWPLALCVYVLAVYLGVDVYMLTAPLLFYWLRSDVLLSALAIGILTGVHCHLSGSVMQGLGLVGLYLVSWDGLECSFTVPRWVKYGFFPAHYALIGVLRFIGV